LCLIFLYLLRNQFYYIILEIISNLFIMMLSWELVVPINVALATTTSIEKILPLFFMVNDKKSKRFNGLNFKRWQHKILLYITTLNLAKFLSNNKFDSIIMVTLDIWTQKHFGKLWIKSSRLTLLLWKSL
jgi:hypothetical protein